MQNKVFHSAEKIFRVCHDFLLKLHWNFQFFLCVFPKAFKTLMLTAERNQQNTAMLFDWQAHEVNSTRQQQLPFHSRVFLNFVLAIHAILVIVQNPQNRAAGVKQNKLQSSLFRRTGVEECILHPQKKRTPETATHSTSDFANGSIL